MKRIDIDEIKNIALNAILQNYTLSALLQAIFKYTTLPIICFDTSFRHIAHAFNEPFYYDAWVDIAENGSAQERNIVDYKYLEIQEEFFKAKTATYYNKNRGKYHPSVNGPIIINDELVAYLGIMVEDYNTDDVINTTNVLCSTVSIILSSNNPGTKFFDLQIENITEERIKTSTGHIVKGPYLFTILSPNDKGMASILFAKNYFSKNSNSCISSIGNNNTVYILFYNLSASKKSNHIYDLLHDFSKKYNFCVFSSCIFNNINSSDLFREQAEMCFHLRTIIRHSNGCYFFQKMIHDVLGYITLRCISPRILIDSDLINIIDSQNEQWNESIHTLFCFIVNFSNYTQTAKYLKKHKNTVLYQIKKLEELLSIDVMDSFQMDKLLLAIISYSILKGNHIEEWMNWENE